MRVTLSRLSFYACALLLSGLGLITGCVLSSGPIGGPSRDIDLEDWEGVWAHEESFGIEAIVAVVRASSQDDAHFDVDWLEIEGDSTQLRRWTGVLTRLEDALVLNLRDSAEIDMPPRYFWAFVEKDGDSVLAGIPGYEGFEKLVNDGVLSGDVDGSGYEVTLDKLNAEEVRFLSSGSLPTFPMIFRRIGS